MRTTREVVESVLGSEVLRDLNSPTVKALGLPKRANFDPEFFEAECELLFSKTWVAAGVASDIPDPGDVVPVSIANRNVILLRDDQRRVRGFYNACRHRGAKLLSEPAKCLKSITCPFHHWTYALDGSLRGTPYLGGVGKHRLEGFDNEDLGLREIAVGQWCNTLFVNLDGQAPPLKEHLASLIKHLGGDRDWDGLHHRSPASIKEPRCKGNWKEYVAVSLEEFHTKFVHPQAFTGIDPLTWRDEPVVEGNVFGSQSWLSGSYGAGYKYYSGTPLPQWLERGNEWMTYVMVFPNLGIYATSDQLALEFFLPNGIESHDFRQEFYFAKGVAFDPAYDGAIDAIKRSWELFVVQDTSLLEGLHDNERTNQAIDNRPRFAGDWEVMIQRYLQYYVTFLQRALDRSGPRP